MNQFNALCTLASKEKWCWKLFCTTCGHIHFQYSFQELANGKSPADNDWVVSKLNNELQSLLGYPQQKLSNIQKECIISTCLDMDIKNLSLTCSFPNWLGYLGLLIEAVKHDSGLFYQLSSCISKQLKELIPADSMMYDKLNTIEASNNSWIDIRDLEVCETLILESRSGRY